ncbi:MAG: response regulator transcription factor [Eubacterium sp.]|nr:response regulator transcription factor [Eubacterium sp.]MBQ8981866.1 response regulator transcription factor [Eubacterium sp.]MBR1531557.1 response regulator transcription factor [Eubacterium sp.]MBR2278680.1 response regulator transcription factor [Eubacterium sp.]
MMKILFAEDELDLSKAVTTVLTAQGFDVTPVHNGREALEESSKSAFDCMVLDIMMPEMDGIEALTQIRARGDVTPVIMLTAKAEIDDRVTGLDAGADDYLTKPFAMKELIARIKSQTRRFGTFNSTQLTYGNLTLDTAQLELVAANSIRLARKEAELMELLMLNSDKELATEEIWRKVWREEEAENIDLVYMYISYLRQKLRSVNADITILGERDKSYKLTTLR